MSQISSTLGRADSAAGAVLRNVGSALNRWWAAYIDWRLKQLAIAQLRGMSDRELRDIGISRSEIEVAVRGEGMPNWAFTRYY